MRRVPYFASALLAVLSVDAKSAPLYRITDLSSQIPFSVTELDLNNSGQLAGSAGTSGFRWDAQSGFVRLDNHGEPMLSIEAVENRRAHCPLAESAARRGR